MIASINVTQSHSLAYTYVLQNKHSSVHTLANPSSTTFGNTSGNGGQISRIHFVVHLYLYLHFAFAHLAIVSLEPLPFIYFWYCVSVLSRIAVCRICVICIAPSHSIISNDMEIESVEFQNGSFDLSKNSVHGKRKSVSYTLSTS